MIKSPVMRAFLLIFFAAAGLFAQKVTIEFDQSTDFSKYKAFA